MTLDIGADVEKVVLAALPPDTVVVFILDALAEEGSDVALLGGAGTLVVLADAAAQEALVIALLALLPEVLAATDLVAALDLARDGQGVAVYERNVAVPFARARDETFEFGVAGARVGFGADEHGAAGVIVVGHADLLGAFAEFAAAGPGPVHGVAPVRVVRGESKTLRLPGRFGLVYVGDLNSRIGHGSAVFVVRG